MGMLDFLINDNKKPTVGMEYIYLLDMVWEDGRFESLPFEYGSIVTDVEIMDNSSFKFKLKGSDKIYKTNYGWSLVENTVENKIKLDKYLESNKKLEEIKIETKRLRNEVKDLNGQS